MKLAEALVLRADTQKKLESLRQRIGKNAIVQEGNKPHEDPSQLTRLSQLENGSGYFHDFPGWEALILRDRGSP
jgi:hypothetical protein